MPYYIGLMSGTSMDAIDTALVSFDGARFSLIDFIEYALPATVKKRLKSINAQSPIHEIAELDVMLGKLFAEAVAEVLNKNQISSEDILAIGSHGQTVFHDPDNAHPTSWQIADPNIIASQTGIATVADFRRKDLALGGQGAPLAPIFHALQFACDHHRIILNAGGFSNITLLSPSENDPIIGFDCGPANVLMDDWISSKQDKPFDKDGTWAASGNIHKALLQDCLAEPYFAADIPKSTGRDLFNLDWLTPKLPASISDEDVQATLLALSVETIAVSVEQYADNTEDMIVCGGGAYNRFFMDNLRNRLPHIKIYDSENCGLNPSAVEACCFAWLAHQRLNNAVGNLPSVTNATSQTVLGGIYSGQ